jgi:hypothetical protein
VPRRVVFEVLWKLLHSYSSGNVKLV